MSIKLFSLAKELNIGVSTLAGFLKEKGKEVEENNPNTRIENEDVNFILDKVAGSVPSETLQKAAKKFAKKKGTEVEELRAEDKQSEKSVTPSAQDVQASLSVEPISGPKIIGKIDIDKGGIKKETLENSVAQAQETKPTEALQPKAAEKKQTSPVPTEEPKQEVLAPKMSKKEEKEKKAYPASEEKKKEPQSTAPVEPKPEQEKPEEVEKNPVLEEEKPLPKEEEKELVVSQDTPMDKEEASQTTEPEIFRIEAPTPENKIKVLGKIDLNAINSNTRPRRKSKEELRKEKLKNATPVDATSTDGKQKRRRVKKNAVDIKSEAARGIDRSSLPSGDRDKGVHGNNAGSNRSESIRRNAPKSNKKSQHARPEVTDEDVQRQVKETLARLTNKRSGFGKAAKYRKDKRDAARLAAEEAMGRSQEESTTLKLTEFVTVSDLANMMDVPVNDVIATCMSIDMMVSINQRLDAETIKIVAEEFGFTTEFVSADVVEAINADDTQDAPEDLEPRVPIVTVMGHVDHGKTSLLDSIRNADVTAGEAGGITQHIGAYNVKLKSGRHITFLDTPGHEAFTAMRARGAQVTDIAIIIIAADDMIMPQTIEAINHATAAGVPMVFAINKIDKPGAQPDKIREQLANMNFLVEEWGGKYQCQEISAKKGIGVEDLLEKVLLEADLLELKANPNRRASGSVIESSLDKGRGYVSTVLVQNGTLNMGDIILAGKYFGRIKAMFNERNQRIKTAGPSTPVQVLGFNGAPSAGDAFNVLETEQEAREIANRREQLQREQGLRTKRMPTLDEIGRRIAIGNFQELNLIIKGDVDGSVQALSDSLIKLSTPEIQVNVIHHAVGQISESDVVLATASDAIIIGFQVRPSAQARKNAEQEGVEIRTYSIIYDAINEVKTAMEGMLSPEIKENFTANIEVQQVFKISKVGTIAGCMVIEGKVKRTDKVRVIRDGIVIHSGVLESLKRFKDDVKEVPMGLECGLNIKNFNDLMEGDIIESFEEIEVRKKL